jgi:hypothetical protein
MVEYQNQTENIGLLPGGVTFETFKLCRKSSTFVKNLNKFDGCHLKSLSGESVCSEKV